MNAVQASLAKLHDASYIPRPADYVSRSFSAGKLGSCQRAQLLRAAGVKSTAPPATEEMQQQWRAGQVIENWIVALLRDSGALIDDQRDFGSDKLRLSGYADAIVWTNNHGELSEHWGRHNGVLVLPTEEGRIKTVEVKSAGVKTWNWLERMSDDMEVDGASWSHRQQLASYWALGIEEDMVEKDGDFEVWLVSRDTFRIVVTKITEADLHVAQQTIRELNAHLVAGTLPDCTCFTDNQAGRFEWKICSFQGLGPDYTNIGGGYCCGQRKRAG